MKKIVLLFCIIIILLQTIFPANANPVPTGDSVRLHQDLNQILLDKRFNYPDHFAWWKRLFNRIGNWLRSLKTPHYQVKGDWLDEFFKKFGLVLVIIAPIFGLFFFNKLFSGNSKIKEKQLVQPDQSPGLPENLKQAERSAVQGDYRNAIRYLYLAALIQLKSAGSLPEGTRFTDKENLITLRKTLGNQSPVYRSFNQLVNIFQEKWYGLKNCTASDYQQANQFFDALSTKIAKGQS